jgi:hypothetical protein
LSDLPSARAKDSFWPKKRRGHCATTTSAPSTSFGLLRDEEGIASLDPDGERWTIHYRGLNGSLRTAIRIGVTARHGRPKVTMTLLR